jgi:hypothetical protein
MLGMLDSFDKAKLREADVFAEWLALRGKLKAAKQ